MVDRVIIMVLDGFGVGEAPDANKYGDEGSNTLAGIYNNASLNIPNMANLGLYNIDGVKAGEKQEKSIGAYGKAQEQADGKNSPVGHWEMSGYIKHPAFTTYPNAFPKKLIDEFMPGMITLVLKKKSILSDDFTAGLETIGIRIPDDPFVLELLKRVGPMLVTSANISGQETLLNDLDVYHEFNGKLKMIVKGKCKNTLASTVVKIDDDVTILRQGCISEEKIREVLK